MNKNQLLKAVNLVASGTHVWYCDTHVQFSSRGIPTSYMMVRPCEIVKIEQDENGHGRWIVTDILGNRHLVLYENDDEATITENKAECVTFFAYQTVSAIERFRDQRKALMDGFKRELDNAEDELTRTLKTVLLSSSSS